MKDLDKAEVVTPVHAEDAEGAEGELPVVMRVMVEIRSDGTRTIARAAVKNAALGQEVAVQAEGGTPLDLATKLIRFTAKVPLLGRQLRKALGAHR